MSAGKGDRVRPYNRKLWDKGWDRAFGKVPTPFFDGVKELDKILEKANKQYPDSPCKHPGCKSHVTHPCEVCGYQGDKNA